MDENHRDKTDSKLVATENKLWVPPLSPKDQQRLGNLHNNPKKATIKGIGFSGKTLWDWLPLFIQLLGALAIPVAIALATAWFSYQQNQTSLQVSERQHQTDLQIEADQQRETTLKTYLDDMSNLLLNNKLLESKPGDVVRQVARERTLTTLRRLDASRNRLVLQFLQDAHLISGKDVVITLSFANLSGADLKGADLTITNLKGADLKGADLGGAELFYTNLTDAYLGGADLKGADLTDAYLTDAYLKDAKGITSEELVKKTRSLQDATMPDGSKFP